MFKHRAKCLLILNTAKQLLRSGARPCFSLFKSQRSHSSTSTSKHANTHTCTHTHARNTYGHHTATKSMFNLATAFNREEYHDCYCTRARRDQPATHSALFVGLTLSPNSQIQATVFVTLTEQPTTGHSFVTLSCSITLWCGCAVLPDPQRTNHSS